MTVADKIKKLRKEARLTQKELGDKLDVATTAVSAWERNANNPKMDKLLLMAKIFDVPVSYFFDENNPSIITNEIFGKRLHELRQEESSLTMKELSKLIGVTENALDTYEKGERVPDTEVLSKLADIFNTTVDYLIGRSDIKNPEQMTNEGISNEDYEKLTAYQKEVVDFIISRENLFFYDQPQKILDALEEFEMFYEFTKKRDQNKKD